MINNLKEFKALIERYGTISLDEISEEWEKSVYHQGHSVANSLTGFGSSRGCTLCKVIRKVHDSLKCECCVYGRPPNRFGCSSDINELTYEKIDNAETPEELFQAFRDRAEHLKSTYSELL